MNKIWEQIKARYNVLTQQLLNTALDSVTRNKVQKELSHISALLAKREEVNGLEKKIDEARQQLEETHDEELKILFHDEIADLKEQLESVREDLDVLMYPPNELDDRPVYLEIRAGAGGQEAALFAADLMNMYINYAHKKGWRVTVDSSSTTDLGGIREVVLHIQGKDVYGYLKHESGVHRVQRVPATETSGRVHTSTATVAVLPEAKDVDVTINPEDLRIDVYRSSGAGGQHVNTTDSAVRITHIPTGVVVACQDERSQHKNKAKAMKILQSRLLAYQVEQQEAERSKKRKELVGGGMRAEKVRTYNFPQNRVTDHQVNLTLKKLDMILEGDLDEIIQALWKKEQEARKHDFLSTLN